MKVVSCLVLFTCLLKSASSLQPTTSFTRRSVTNTPAASSRLFATAEMGEEIKEETEAATEWTKKRVWNTGAFRSIAILGALSAAGFSAKSPLNMVSAQAAATIHVLSFATWFGTVAYTTFVAGITMFKNLPRQTFGKLQAKLFPKYFALSSIMLVLQLATLKSLSILTTKSTKALGISLVMTLINQFYLEPTSTDNMMERYRLEDTGGQDSEQYKKLKASFGKFHGMSSLTNLIAFCGGIAHAVYLGAALV